jgi:hypothetical protein
MDARERKILTALKGGAGPLVSTVDEISAGTSLSAAEVAKALAKLASRQPPLVRSELDATLQREFWFATEAAIGALEEAEAEAEDN